MKRSALDLWVREKEGLSRLTREDIEEIQLGKLNRLLEREQERGGFYRDLPSHVDCLSDLSRLPFTTEADLKEQGHRMTLLSQSKVERVRTEETSGTTGQAKRVYYSGADHERTISFFAAGLSELVHPEEKTMICMPFSGPGGLGELIAEAIRRLGAVPLPAGIGKSYGALLEILKKEEPETFVGMPVPLLSLLRLHKESSLKRALISADACPETVAAEIEKRLGNRLYPHYGSRESGLGGAVTCPAFSGMHLRENDIIAEIVDASGAPLPRGQWGELVITTVQAEAMPLIRYRTGDYTRLIPEPCPCGSELARLDLVTRIPKKRQKEKRNLRMPESNGVSAGLRMPASDEVPVMQTDRGPARLRVPKTDGPIAEVLSMPELDECVFSIREIVDYRAGMEDGILHLEGYVTEACEELPSELLGCPVRWELQPVREGHLPCYPAKRSILRGRERESL